jgi:hypothetical protein
VAQRTGAGTRTETALVVGLIALGSALRIQGIASHPLWIDEHGTWWAVAGQGPGELWQRVISVHGQSPLYYAIVDAGASLLGPTPLALRLPSLVLGIALLGLAVPLARATVGRPAAIAALAAFAVNERLIFYSQEARPYALALLCSALSCWAWLALLRDPRGTRPRAAWLLATAACFYAHYLFGLLILVQAAHWAIHHARPLRAAGATTELRAWLANAVILLCLLLPATPQLVHLFARREMLDWVHPTSSLRLLRIYFDGDVLAWTAGAALLTAGLARGITLPTPPSRAALVALWLALPFAAIALLPPLFDVSLSDRRYVAVALPAVPLVYGLLMTLPARGAGRAGLPLGVLVDATHFVELDAVVQGTASDEERELSAWPVAAYLPPERRASLRALPYRDSPGLLPVFQARLEEAARVQRSWVIGKQPVIAHFVRLAVQHPRVEVVAHERFARLYLIRLRGRPGAASPRRLGQGCADGSCAAAPGRRLVALLEWNPPALALWPRRHFDGRPDRALDVHAPRLARWVRERYPRTPAGELLPLPANR